MSEKPISPRCVVACWRTWLSVGSARRLNQYYIRQIETFTLFLGRSPDTATAEDVRRFQVHLTETGVGPSSINQGSHSAAFLLWHYTRPA